MSKSFKREMWTPSAADSPARQETSPQRDDSQNESLKRDMWTPPESSAAEVPSDFGGFASEEQFRRAQELGNEMAAAQDAEDMEAIARLRGEIRELFNDADTENKPEEQTKFFEIVRRSVEDLAEEPVDLTEVDQEQRDVVKEWDDIRRDLIQKGYLGVDGTLPRGTIPRWSRDQIASVVRLQQEAWQRAQEAVAARGGAERNGSTPAELRSERGQLIAQITRAERTAARHRGEGRNAQAANEDQFAGRLRQRIMEIDNALQEQAA